MKSDKPLYEADGKKVYYSDFVNALREAGVKKGDTIFVHSDISLFGKLQTSDRDLLFGSLVDSLKESVGNEGTIIMPTFSFSFSKNQPYDVENSKSTVGVLTEFFRNQQDVSRTIHPNHSAAVWGKHKKYLMDISKDTFDEGSIFGKLHQLKGKLVFFGVTLTNSCTFIHYIEQMHGVPFRYIKKFKGRIIEDGKEYEDEFSFYCKYLCFFVSMLKLEKHLLEKGLLKEVRVGKGVISMIDADDMFKEAYKLLDEDIYFFLKNEPFIFRLFNVCIYPFLRFMPWPLRILDKTISNIFFLN